MKTPTFIEGFFYVLSCSVGNWLYQVKGKKNPAIGRMLSTFR